LVKKLLDASSVSKLRLFKLNHKYQGIQQNLIFFLFDIVSVQIKPFALRMKVSVEQSLVLAIV
jgi:hypothetical protein